LPVAATTPSIGSVDPLGEHRHVVLGDLAAAAGHVARLDHLDDSAARSFAGQDDRTVLVAAHERRERRHAELPLGSGDVALSALADQQRRDLLREADFARGAGRLRPSCRGFDDRPRSGLCRLFGCRSFHRWLFTAGNCNRGDGGIDRRDVGPFDRQVVVQVHEPAGDRLKLPGEIFRIDQISERFLSLIDGGGGVAQFAVLVKRLTLSQRGLGGVELRGLLGGRGGCRCGEPYRQS
jgi:hypothetical protein